MKALPQQTNPELLRLGRLSRTQTILDLASTSRGQGHTKKMTLLLEKPQGRIFFFFKSKSHPLVYNQTSKRVRKWKEEHTGVRHTGHSSPSPTGTETPPKDAHQGAAAQSTFQVVRKLMLTLSLTIIISIPQTFSRQSGKAVAQGLDGGAEEGMHFG